MDLVCYRSTLGLGHKFQIHACHKIKEGPLCMGCLFVLIGILLIYFKISRGIQTIKKQNGDQHGLNVVPLDPPSILNCLTIRLWKNLLLQSDSKPHCVHLRFDIPSNLSLTFIQHTSEATAMSPLDPPLILTRVTARRLRVNRSHSDDTLFII